MAESKDNYSGGDKILSSDLNQTNKNANDGGGFRDDIDAGETINGATTPVPVYQDSADDELYKCDANDNTKLNFIGFAISNSTDGNPIDFQGEGIVRGFSGLTAGAKYYVQDTAGTIGTTPGTKTILVGFAISATELLIIPQDKKTHFGSVAHNSAGTTGVTTGFRPRFVLGVGTVGQSFGYSDGSNNYCLSGFGSGVNPAVAGYIAYYNNGAGSIWAITANNFTETGFDSVASVSGAPPSPITVYYLAIA